MEVFLFIVILIVLSQFRIIDIFRVIFWVPSMIILGILFFLGSDSNEEGK